MKITTRDFIVFCMAMFAIVSLGSMYAPKLYIGGGGYFTDTTSALTALNKGLNVNGQLLVNGSPVSGGSGTPIVGSDESVGLIDEITGVNFIGNIYTATADTGSGLLTLTADIDTLDFWTRFNMDSSKVAYIDRTKTWSSDQTFVNIYAEEDITALGNIIGADITSTGNMLSSGDMDVTGTLNVNGWRNPNSTKNLKTKYLTGVLPPNNPSFGVLNLAHGISSWTFIRDVRVLVKHDTSSSTWAGFYSPNGMYAPHQVYWQVTDTHVKFTNPGGTVLSDDTVYVWVDYSDSK